MGRGVLITLMALAGLGCEAPAAVAPAEPTFELVASRVLSTCTTRSCHGGVGRKGDLVLTGDQAYQNLVNVPASNEAAKAAGKLRVVPGQPDASFLMQKLTAPAPGEGERMPLVGGVLPAEDLALVRAWIEAGAKPPGS